MDNHFTIVIPSYNNEQWVKKCLGSALGQDYDNYDVVYINDCSTDNTIVVAEQLIKDTETKAEVRVVNNTSNQKALYNLYYQIKEAKKGSIIVTLDGDDWLPNDGVLKALNKTYESKDIWMTAGSYIDNVAGMISCPSIVERYWFGNIRMKPWTISHLRTFRRELFMKIKYEDLMDNDDYFYKFTFDQAMMYPMAEMSGPEHFREIKQVMYVYNRQNPISVDRVHRQDQLRIEQQIRFKQEYERLESLDD
jgi:glycosyltransferase involved in cell wall biosynthesis